MTVYRKWYCNCTGKPLELEYQSTPADEDDVAEPACRRCGARPSSDPKHTVSFKDVDNWDD